MRVAVIDDEQKERDRLQCDLEQFSLEYAHKIDVCCYTCGFKIGRFSLDRYANAYYSMRTKSTSAVMHADLKLADFLLTDMRTHTIIGKSANADILLCVNAGHSPDAHFIWLYLCRAEMLCRIDRVEKGSVRTYESLIRSTKLIGETRRRDHEDIYG